MWPALPLPESAYAAGRTEVHPDEKGPAHDVLVGHEAPIAAVQAVVAVIAHHEIVAFGHGAAHTVAQVLTILTVGIIGNRHVVLRRLLVKQNIVLNRPQLFGIPSHIGGTVRLEV